MSTFDSETISRAAMLWNYMASFRSAGACDAVVVCCSYDLRVCDYACGLIKSGLSTRLVLSGKTGNWTRQLWSDTEAAVFKLRALENGIPDVTILLEDRSTNFGENIAFTRALLPAAKAITFVTKPASVLRVKLTAEVQWPGIARYTACPALEFPRDVSNVVGLFGIINEMVGDIERIQRYPALGFQSPHDLPREVLGAWRHLIREGFTHHLMEQA
ncbi:MAG TPA: YdcF family protein [Gemmatimonadales bacterium]|nr:YdcF family protein [Gemmatimonadales bacterium]